MNVYIPEWAMWAAGVLFVLLFWRKGWMLLQVIWMVIIGAHIQ